VGAGVTMHLNNALRASGDVLDGTLGFATATGGVLQAEYVHRNYAFDVRYTRLEYTVNRGGSGVLDASSLGAGVTVFFTGKKRATRTAP
jgi:hypothetical protein